MNEAAVIEAIRSILKRGNDAQIQRRGQEWIVLEVSKKIKYKSPADWGGGKAIRADDL